MAKKFINYFSVDNKDLVLMVSYVVSTCKQVDANQSMKGNYTPKFIHEHEATALLREVGTVAVY